MLHREAVSSAESTAEGKVDEFTWELWAEIAVGLTGCPHYGHQVKQVLITGLIWVVPRNKLSSLEDQGFFYFLPGRLVK